MANFKQTEVLQNIQELIDKSRCGIDGFFTDSRMAASDILRYLENENLIAKHEQAVEMQYNERNKAA